MTESPYRLNAASIAALRASLGQRIGPAFAIDATIRLGTDATAVAARAVWIESGPLVLRFDAQPPPSESSPLSPLSLSTEPITQDTQGTRLDITVGPVSRIEVFGSDGVEVAIVFRANEATWMRERRPNGGLTARRGESRETRLCIAVEASVDRRVWLARNDALIDDLIEGYQLSRQTLIEP